jgi:two-component system response regulator
VEKARLQHAFTYVDDLDANRQLFSLAFRRTGLEKPLVLLSDGEELVRFLKGEAPFETRDRTSIPAIVLLDLRMQKMDGFETLRWIRGNEQFKKLVVLMFSSSGEESDIEKAFELGANSYIRKPVEFAALVHAIELINEYWFGCNSCPRRPGS